jgi:hypothetical protein
MNLGLRSRSHSFWRTWGRSKWQMVAWGQQVDFFFRGKYKKW